jgi:hypothetical protein
MKEVIDEMSHSLDSPNYKLMLRKTFISSPGSNFTDIILSHSKGRVGHHSETSLDKKLEFCHPLIELLQFEMQKIGVSAEEQSSGV